MTDYNNTYGGAAKDAANSTILGADIDTELDAVETHVATKSNKVVAADVDNILVMDGNGDLKDSTQTILELKSQLEPIGTIFQSTSATNPGTSKGFGTWTQIAKGRTLIGEGTGAGLTARTAAATGGVEDSIVPAHTHTGTTVSDTHNHSITTDTSESGSPPVEITGGSGGGTNGTDYTNNDSHSHTFTTDSEGESVTDKNMQPYLVVYIFERTA